jgi:oligopeptidase B
VRDTGCSRFAHSDRARSARRARPRSVRLTVPVRLVLASTTEQVTGLAPAAKRIPHRRSRHADVVVDEYAWLANKDDPDTIAYLVAENEYTQARTAHLAELRDTVFTEIRTRTKETDLSVPVRKVGHWYYTRTVAGQQYPIHCRRAIVPGELTPPSTADGQSLDGEQVLLDGNVLAEGSDFFALGTFDVSPGGNLLAYSVDLSGDERFTLRIKDLRTGELLPDEVVGVFYGSAWSRDGGTLFYLTMDEAWRPYRVWRHTVGRPTSTDVLVFAEADERFFIGIGLTRSEAYVVITVHSKVTSEVHLIPADAPIQSARVVRSRRQGIEYEVEHDPGGRRFLVLHNEDARDFALAWAPETEPGDWRPMIAHEPGCRLLGVDAFAGHVVVSLRRDGYTALRVLPGGGEAYHIDFPDPIHTVGLDANEEYQTDSLRLHYASLITPASIYQYDLSGRSMTLLKRQPVLGGFDPAGYQQYREWATAPDGTRVPISLMCRAGTDRGGDNPTVLYGYGSYEASMDPWFSIARLSLVDRGVVFAVAHVRGGGELGRDWYEQGKLLTKRNTFTDFVACAEHLCATGWTSPARLVARGGSAGGLLMGVAANIAPDMFAGVVAEVPFVDALNTILDPSLPLTVTEWEEWGNPVESAEVYRYMKGYSPYENLTARPYPAILAVTSLHDTRVLFHEPAKWIARLRGLVPDGDFLLKTEMGAGHGGRSGRYDAWREEAFVVAWILDRLGRGSTPGQLP